MTWPLPTLPNPIQGKPAVRGARNESAGPQQGLDMNNPLTALWMLANQPQPTATGTPALGTGPAYQMAHAPNTASQTAAYNKAAATPLSADSSPFSSLALTMHHDAFSQRFPWMGE